MITHQINLKNNSIDIVCDIVSKVLIDSSVTDDRNVISRKRYDSWVFSTILLSYCKHDSIELGDKAINIFSLILRLSKTNFSKKLKEAIGFGFIYIDGSKMKLTTQDEIINFYNNYHNGLIDDNMFKRLENWRIKIVDAKICELNRMCAVNKRKLDDTVKGQKSRFFNPNRKVEVISMEEFMRILENDKAILDSECLKDIEKVKTMLKPMVYDEDGSGDSIKSKSSVLIDKHSAMTVKTPPNNNDSFFKTFEKTILFATVKYEYVKLHDTAFLSLRNNKMGEPLVQYGMVDSDISEFGITTSTYIKDLITFFNDANAIVETNYNIKKICVEDDSFELTDVTIKKTSGTGKKIELPNDSDRNIRISISDYKAISCTVIVGIEDYLSTQMAKGLVTTDLNKLSLSKKIGYSRAHTYSLLSGYNDSGWCRSTHRYVIVASGVDSETYVRLRELAKKSSNRFNERMICIGSNVLLQIEDHIQFKDNFCWLTFDNNKNNHVNVYSEAYTNLRYKMIVRDFLKMDVTIRHEFDKSDFDYLKNFNVVSVPTDICTNYYGTIFDDVFDFMEYIFPNLVGGTVKYNSMLKKIINCLMNNGYSENDGENGFKTLNSDSGYMHVYVDIDEEIAETFILVKKVSDNSDKSLMIDDRKYFDRKLGYDNHKYVRSIYDEEVRSNRAEQSERDKVRDVQHKTEMKAKISEEQALARANHLVTGINRKERRALKFNNDTLSVAS